MRSRQPAHPWLAVMSFLLVACVTAAVQGYHASRVGRLDTYLGGQYQSGVSSMLRGQPVEIALRNTGLFATGIGYHFHDHFAVNLNMAFGTTSMTLDGPDPNDTVKQDAYLFTKGLAATTFSKLNDAERWFQYIQGTLVFGWSY